MIQQVRFRWIESAGDVAGCTPRGPSLKRGPVSIEGAQKGILVNRCRKPPAHAAGPPITSFSERSPTLAASVTRCFLQHNASFDKYADSCAAILQFDKNSYNDLL
jgi:hypothetical protein